MVTVPPPARGERILIVKLGAFGNIVLSFAAFTAIRHHHAGAWICVLTSETYAPWLRTFPWFDEVLVDPRPNAVDFKAMQRLSHMLADGHFNRVYDLQTNTRSSRYLSLFPAKHRPEWSGIAYGCSHPDRDPKRNSKYDVTRQLNQLRQAGITEFPPVDLTWMRGDITRFALPADYAILVPGASAGRPAKRWPAARYQELAERLRERGIAPVIIGAGAEKDLAPEIPAAINLIGQTSFADIVSLAQGARFTVGNDTGPMHLIAVAGCPTITLFSNDSNPSQCAPSGRWTRVLQRPILADLPVDAVLESLPE